MSDYIFSFLLSYSYHIEVPSSAVSELLIYSVNTSRSAHTFCLFVYCNANTAKHAVARQHFAMNDL